MFSYVLQTFYNNIQGISKPLDFVITLKLYYKNDLHLTLETSNWNYIRHVYVGNFLHFISTKAGNGWEFHTKEKTSSVSTEIDEKTVQNCMQCCPPKVDCIVLQIIQKHEIRQEISQHAIFETTSNCS